METNKRGRKPLTINHTAVLEEILNTLNDKYKKPLLELVKLVQNEKNTEVLKALQTKVEIPNIKAPQTPLDLFKTELLRMTNERLKELEAPHKAEEEQIKKMIQDLNRKYNTNFELTTK